MASAVIKPLQKEVTSPKKTIERGDERLAPANPGRGDEEEVPCREAGANLPARPAEKIEQIGGCLQGRLSSFLSPPS